jgi:hypothetical protein
VLPVVQAVAVAAIDLLSKMSTLRFVACLVAIVGQVSFARATVLPEQRADVMYHEFTGGGVTVSGPSILVRKNTSTNSSVFYNYYIDNVSSASLDVMTGGSPYTEKRTEQSGGIDYLHGKTTMGLAYTSSVENDYKSGTLNFNLSQDFFGDLSTLTLGYTQGKDYVTRRGLSYDLAQVDRQNYRVGLSQILSKNFIVGASWETITDDATSLNGSSVTLNNPYRSYSYLTTDGSGNPVRGFAPEKYPNTHTSNAFSITGSYFLPFRAALHGEIKYYEDSWGVKASTYQVGYTYPLADWIFDFRGRWYNQDRASFYSDMFAYQDQYTFMARDRELATFNSVGIGATASWNFAKNGWGWIDKGSLNLSWDHLEFNYKDFRNNLITAPPGTEPLYAFGADIYQLFVSLWY